ncbi:benzyl alcohol O-benzoyltransferase [Sorghum bicolor]|jgi:hypothetical protein|uniref:Uncharacterized protein n=1 Tax=Sorghum bicolor TaxID=4558 RepID=A0A1B6PIU2_SORBI|nr:benzyl alcohol O-benzoyltransferase [Sorghum bicolor]KXG25604.1 hypothetical protein SORBI_3007G203600 [Sorghum bicolor]|eukprot:XP_021320246.1 benzyl alcohol O-benzoyltransferase [Sorghum bicolor]
MATFLTTSTAGLKFTVRRQPAVLVAPAAPTPRELKRLSDIDDQEGLRFRVPVVQVYRRSASCAGGGLLDPAAVIRDAVARALVHYYPLAGRLRELEGRKLAVDCTAEGVPFAEADADDVRLDDFGDSVHPPLPCLEELLLFDDVVPATATTSSSIANSAVVHIQVTRLACGGFVLAVQMSHTVADALGMLQFLEAVAELARGAAAPTVRPVWARDLLMARNPPRPSFPHREYDDEVPLDDPIALPADQLVQGFVFFTPRDVAAIKARLAPGLRERSTTFDVLTAFLWKCRTTALQLQDADEEVRIGLTVSACHGKRGRLRLPRGYYGNTVVLAVAVSTAGELRANPVSYAVELVSKAKAEVNAEYIQSVADLMVLRGRPRFGLYLVSDQTKIGFAGVDYGWGQPVHGGMAAMALSPLPGMFSFLIPCKNADGEDGIVIPIWLPGHAMDRFTEEVGNLMRPPHKMSSI